MWLYEDRLGVLSVQASEHPPLDRGKEFPMSGGEWIINILIRWWQWCTAEQLPACLILFEYQREAIIVLRAYAQIITSHLCVCRLCAVKMRHRLCRFMGNGHEL
ncbi:hypothetical protein AVEN_154498-1 [Araneus ventricosus]|uniref:Uncharacterized protein n=1 Tax=Araneus ventricosus TaxID=182803 RepID=A0A4Y2UCF3_ARAVE|nr:hypothetical protein AVEN_154498-1 [Araneus ventricosus]